MELGIMTFADMAPETLPDRGINAHQQLNDLMGEIQLRVINSFILFRPGRL